MASTAEQTAAKALPLISGFSDLWESAKAKLDPSELQVFNIAKDKVTKETLKVALDTAKSKQDELEKKHLQHSVKFHDKSYTLHDIWAKICTGIEKITKAIDPFIALDVSGKAALPWAVVKLILGVESSNNYAFTSGLQLIIVIDRGLPK